jgi:WD40 repeat protein
LPSIRAFPSITTSSFVLIIAIAVCALVPSAFADGTRTWEQSKFDDLTKGTATGVAIRSSGGLELAPSFKLLYATPSTYIWSVASDDAGNIYAATGSPARVYRITPGGQAAIIFEPQELQVQALQVGPHGVIYAATAPDGKVYKLEHKPREKSESKTESKSDGKSSGKEMPSDPAKPVLDPSWSSSEYFAPGTKYIWDLALDKAGNLYVATGDHGEIYKVTPKGEHSVFFKSDDTHIRVLALDYRENDAQGNLIAGTDGSGLVYRISPAGEGFVLYSAPKKEITALALDREGNIYAAAVGEKRASATTSPAVISAAIVSMSANAAASAGPQTPGMTVSMAPTTSPAGSFPFPGAGAGNGSDVYRIAPDGSPSRIWTSHEDIVYALAFDPHDHLLAGTGNRGHVFAIEDEGQDEFSDLLKAPATQVTGFAKAPGGGLYAASSNLGKIFLLGPSPEAEGSYESDVFDAKIFSRWGRVEFRGAGNVDLLARSGNVDNPDRNWSPWKPVNLAKDSEMGVPPARYAQWKAVLHTGSTRPAVDTVTLNYLPKNVAPEIDDVVVQVGARYQPLPKSAGLNLGTDMSGSSGIHFDSPVPSTHDRDAIGVKWNAHDENDDQLVYSVYYRGDGETRWLLLKDNLTDKAYSFDASLLPDGGYTVKVVASDAPSHSPGEALTATKESHRFEVDTTPPRVENLTASLEGAQIHVRFRAEDGFSAIKRAEYSVDAGEWKYVEPVGQLSDAKVEDYDFMAPLSFRGERRRERSFIGACSRRARLRQVRQPGRGQDVDQREIN